MKKTKIICTIGPKSESTEILRKLMLNGMNICRLNFSHGSHKEHQIRVDNIKKIRKELDLPIALLLDTKGPEIRLGKFSIDEVNLKVGDIYTLTTEDVLGDEKKSSVSYKELPYDVSVGGSILIDDGLVEMKVISKTSTEITCLVKNNGVIKSNKGVNVPNTKINLPSITEKDRDDILFAIENDFDFIAASFVRKPEDVYEIRKILDENKSDIKIISKIESQEAVNNIDEIIEVSDGIMVARGDLGVEIKTEYIPKIQKEIIRKCNLVGKPVVTATQMLDSMIRNPRPTRAEVTDVANAIYDGTDCVMLSGESAAGKYPVEAVKMMATVCKETEKYLAERGIYHDSGDEVNAAIGLAAVECANRVHAHCIICPTHSGRTARLISNFRPNLPIIAMSPSNHAIRKTCFYWGVTSYKTPEQGSLSATCYNALREAKDHGCVNKGDLVVITAGDPQTSPSQGDYITSTNMTMVAQIQ